MKEDKLQKLIDHYGFSYATAKEITDHPDSEQIVLWISQSYKSGEQSYADSWRGATGGY